MRLLFMGSGDFAVPSLAALLASADHEVAALFTQPDKPAGRGHRIRTTPTKRLATEHGLPVHQPPKIRAPEAVALVEELAPECIVVVAYGQIIPRAILDIPPKGILNVHASLLPRYRGAAPIQWAIVRGEEETGVTTMLMDEGLDTGPVMLQHRTSILADESAGALEARLATAGAELLVATLGSWASGELVPTAQDDSLATLAPKIKKEDARIDWSETAAELSHRVRGFDPWPVAFTSLDEEALKIWRARSGSIRSDSPPGSILSVDEEGVLVACGEQTTLVLEEVQPAGKPRMAAASFARGRRLAPPRRLGDVDLVR